MRKKYILLTSHIIVCYVKQCYVHKNVQCYAAAHIIRQPFFFFGGFITPMTHTYTACPYGRRQKLLLKLLRTSRPFFLHSILGGLFLLLQGAQRICNAEQKNDISRRIMKGAQVRALARSLKRLLRRHKHNVRPLMYLPVGICMPEGMRLHMHNMCAYS